MTTSIKITALTSIGTDIAYTTLVPVVNMAGTPETEKATLQLVGNLILDGAGGSYFPAAASANTAATVTNAAQPNITSTGTLTSVAVQGTATAGNITVSGTTTSGSFVGNTGGYALGYLYMPQREFSTSTSTVLADTGKHLYSAQTSDLSVTVANNASQAFQLGSQIQIINTGTANVNVVADTGVTLFGEGNATPGTKTITSYTIATLTKINTNTWIISGKSIV